MPALSLLVHIVGGGTPSKREPKFWNGDIPWVSVKDFKSSVISEASDYITQEGVDNSATCLIPKGNLIVPTRMALGKVAINTVDVAINQDLKALIIKDKNVIDRDFLLRFLESKSEEIERQGKGATVKGITLDVLKSLEVPTPPLSTQKKIAEILEKADQLCKDCQQMEQELNNLAQAVFIDMFGDDLQSNESMFLGEVASVVSGVTKGQDLKGKETVSVPYMRVANVQAGYLDLSEIKNIEVKVDDVKKYQLFPGDMLLTEGGDFDKLGRGALWEGQVSDCIHQNHVFRVRLDKSLYLPEWFNGFLQTNYAKKYFLGCAKKTTNLASINITQLKGLPLPTISLDRQKNYLSKMKVINEKLLLTKELQSNYSQSFNALVNEAFKGELTLKNKTA